MGRDKAALVLDGAPLWQHQIATLRTLQPEELLISGPPSGPWVGSGIAVIADEVPGLGPLGGLATALTRMRNDRLLVLAVDLPEMSADFLRRLLAVAAHDRGVVPMRDEFFEPLAAIYPRSMKPVAARCLADGEYSLHQLVKAGIEAGLLDRYTVSGSECGFFRNVNAPADLE
jgi:molybdopterin-guanine dinucleotide biosynthesis protein A